MGRARKTGIASASTASNVIIETIRRRDTETPRQFSRRLRVTASLCLFLLFALTGSSFAQTNLEALAEKVRSGNVEQKRDALFQIRNLESAEASRAALPALRDPSEIVRATAAFSVIFLPRAEAAQNLLPLLEDKFELVRREAAYALGKIRNSSAVKPLVEILQKDKILEVRNAAAIALGEIGDAGAIDALAGILQQKPSEKTGFLRRSAARSIGQIAQNFQIGETKTLTPTDFLPDKYRPIHRRYENLSERFPEFKFKTAALALIAILQSSRESDDTKREAAFALGSIADDAAIPVLESNSKAKDYYLAKICEEALKKISLRLS